jgi:hypothetical protein
MPRIQLKVQTDVELRTRQDTGARMRQSKQSPCSGIEPASVFQCQLRHPGLRTQTRRLCAYPSFTLPRRVHYMSRLASGHD